MSAGKKPWSGRFQKSTARSVEKFTASIHYDQRLYPCDIEGSIAHATMLAKQKIIAKKDAQKINVREFFRGRRAVFNTEKAVHIAGPENLI